MVARRAHNPKVVGSNPAPATNLQKKPWKIVVLTIISQGFFSLYGF